MTNGGAGDDVDVTLAELTGDSDSRLALSDLLNHVLDRGVVLLGDVTIGVADVDLIRLRLSVLLAAVESLERRERDADLSVLPRSGGE